MARINLVIDDELDDLFRREVAKRLGMKKGNIKIAIEEALRCWINHPQSLDR
jgi:DNA-directed RNA polymerase specialized sigma24 family protein